MTGREIFHTVIFALFGVVALCEVKGAKKPRKYYNLAIGILCLAIALYDTLVTGFGLPLF